ncbi:tetratricopeptide repeat protein [Micromonospora chersina]|uniref:tetratricopeptide repeat protein n=1 Tax=Micromonospora chersina TaxID=47854 RepID=UPI0036A5CE0A
MLDGQLGKAAPVQAQPAEPAVDGTAHPGTPAERTDDLLLRIDQLRRDGHAVAALRLIEDASPSLSDASAALAITHGRVLLALHRPGDAAAVLRRARELHGDSIEVFAWLIASLSRGRRYDDAMLLAAEARQKFPLSALVCVVVGRLLIDQHRFSESLAYLREAYELDPRDPRVLTWLLHGLGWLRSYDKIELLAAADEIPDTARIEYASTLLDRYQYERALAEVEKVTDERVEIRALQVRLGALCALRRLDEAQLLAEEAVARSPHDPRPRLQLGYVLDYSHRREEALVAFEQALAIDPHDDDALYARAVELRLLRRVDEAERACHEAIARRPDSPQLHVELGNIHDDQHDYGRALAAFDQALAIDPREEWALSGRVAGLRRLRRMDEAEQAARNAIDKRPDSPQPHLDLGYVYDDQGDYERALAAFEQALGIDPKDESALAWRITELRQLNRVDEAERAAREAIDRRPDAPQLHLELANVYDDQDDYKRGLAALEQALAIDPKHDMALSRWIAGLRRLRRLQEAEQAALEAIDKRPDAPQLHFELGIVYDDQDGYERALAAFEQALAIDPEHEWALIWRITELRQLKRLDEAEQAAREAIDKRPNAPQPHLELGNVHTDQHDYERALAAFDQALAIDPKHEVALSRRIAGLRRLRRLQEAEQAALEAIDKRPGSTQPYLDLGYVYDDQDDYEPALAAFEQALAIDPKHEWALAWRITELRHLKRLDEAEQAAREATDKRPDSPQPHLELGYVYNDQHDYERALAAFEQALTIDPAHQSALIWRIIELRNLRRLDEAEQAAREAIDKRPAEGRLLLQLAYVYDDQHDYERALAAFNQALAFDPGDEWALAWRITELRNLRRVNEAEQAALDAIDRRPDSPQLQFELAFVHLDRHDYEQALTAFDQALAIDPRHDMALSGRITALRQLRRLHEAEQVTLEAIDKRPESTQLYVDLGYVYDGQHDYERALTAFDQALIFDSKHEWALAWRVTELRKLRRLDEAERAAREAIDKRPDSPELPLELGNVYYDQHDYERALAAFDQALAIDPWDEWAMSSRIAGLRRLRRLDEAEQAAREAIDKRPDSTQPYLDLGYVYEDQHDYERALAAFDQALAIDARDEWAMSSRIAGLRRLRRLDEAEQAAREAINRRPGSTGMRLAMASIAEDKGDYRAALVAIEEAVALDLRNESALTARIRVTRLSRDFAAALTIAHAAADARPDSVDVLLELGQVHAVRSDDQKALEVFDRALSIDPGHIPAIERRVAVLERLQRHLDAEQCVRSALTLQPMAESLHIMLGRILEDRLRLREALGSYENAARFNPKSPRVLAHQSAALRALRSYAEAERLVGPLARQQPHLRALAMELAWIQHDSGRLAVSRSTFARLEREALSKEERAAAIAGLGWVDFAGGDYVAAEQGFHQAVELMPVDRGYRLAQAWALVRQDEQVQWEQAEQICLGVLGEQQDAAALVCLGVIDYRLGRLPAAEYHLAKALEIDFYKGSHTDLAALYTQLGRYDEAERHLQVAIAQDPYNASAQVELGHLRLLTGEPQEAARQFRGVLRVDPTMEVAALGLAEALTALGRSREAEDVLREGLRTATLPWRLHLALARLLFHQADATQNDDVFAEAYAEAIEAIKSAPGGEADPHYVAAVCKVRLSESTTAGTLGDARSRRQALQHLRRCLSTDEGHVDAQRLVQLLERDRRTARTAAFGTATVASVAMGLLAVMWTAFFLSDRVTVVMITTITPILVGLVAVAVLLPSLIRLKLPGFEADLQAGLGQITSGPTGEVVIRPGNLAISTGPVGHAPNHRHSEYRQLR